VFVENVNKIKRMVIELHFTEKTVLRKELTPV